MDTFLQKIKIIVTEKAIRDRILFVLVALVIFRGLTSVPIPGVDLVVLEQFFQNNQFLGLLNIFSGGGLSNLSIVMLGVGPFITASIIMQLMTVMSPTLKAMYSEEGETGRAKFTQYSRMLMLPLAILQAFGFLSLLKSQGVISGLSTMEFLVNILIVVAGSALLLWLGELVTEYGIGNGVSIIIFAGIVATLPSSASQLMYNYDPSQVPLYAAFVVAAIAIYLWSCGYDTSRTTGTNNARKAGAWREDIRRYHELSSTQTQPGRCYSNHFCALDSSFSANDS
jgi:preprotein translocase subunit SecY